MIKVLQINTKLDKRIFFASFAIAVLAIFAYVYMVTAIVFNITATKQIEYQTRGERAEVGSLESKNLGLQKDINKEHAYALGLVDTKNIKYARVDSDTKVTLYDKSQI